MYLAAVLHAIALLIALNVQSMSSPLAGAWLLFHFAGCICSYRPSDNKNLLWSLALGWLITIGVSCFILAPVVNGATTMWILAAMPMLALSVRKDNLEAYADCFMAVIILYAIGLIVQMMIGVRYTSFEYWVPWRHSYAVAWPLLDPNNAAALMNAALVPWIYMSLRNPKYLFMVALFILALIATASRAGGMVALITSSILIAERFGFAAGSFLFIAASGAVGWFWTALMGTLQARLEIWKGAWPLLWIHPITGLGLGSFGHYYDQVRIETTSGGWYAHNDILQFAIEMGLPAAFVFCLLMLAMALMTWRRNIVSGCVLLALFLQAMVEFQFYVPALSLVAGLAMAYHMVNYGPSRRSLVRA